MIGDPGAARAFADEHAHYTADLPLWRRLAHRLDGPVLDLGCASGRVAVELARDGSEVWALDGDPHMLAEAAQAAAAHGAEVAQRLRTVPGDMRDFTLGTRFGLVICAMNTMQVLLDPDDHVACLGAVRRHLADDGEFWFDVALPDVADIMDTMGLVRAGDEHTGDDGVRWLHSSWYEDYEPLSQTADYALRVERIEADGASRTSVRRHTVHLFTPVEIHHLLERAGLEPLEVFGDFDGEPLTAAATRQVYRCGVAS